MRTVAQIKHRLEYNRHYLETHFDEITKAAIKRMVKHNELLLELQRYLETKPKKTFIEKEKNRVKRIIAAKESQFYHWRTTVLDDNTLSENKQRRIFCKESGITTLRKQLINLNFLLNENQEHPAFR
jgi:hypothetical protein